MDEKHWIPVMMVLKKPDEVLEEIKAAIKWTGGTKGAKIRKNMGTGREKIAQQPTSDPETCTDCGACAEFCPNDVLALAEGVRTVANPLNGVPAWGRCASKCRMSAIVSPQGSGR